MEDNLHQFHPSHIYFKIAFGIIKDSRYFHISYFQGESYPRLLEGNTFYISESDKNKRIFF